MELYADKTPLTVNFVNLATGYYDNLIFHRVIRRFYGSGRLPER